MDSNELMCNGKCNTWYSIDKKLLSTATDDRPFCTLREVFHYHFRGKCPFKRGVWPLHPVTLFHKFHVCFIIIIIPPESFDTLTKHIEGLCRSRLWKAWNCSLGNLSRVSVRTIAKWKQCRIGLYELSWTDSIYIVLSLSLLIASLVWSHRSSERV